jgi:hypothetical protein
MGVSKEYKLTAGQKCVGILIVCLLFCCLTIYCLRQQELTYEYVCDRDALEYKSAFMDNGFIHTNEVTDDYAFATHPIILPSGKYTIDVTFVSTASGTLLVQGNNDCVFDIQLPTTYGAEQIVSDQHLILPLGTDRCMLKFYQTEPGDIVVEDIRIRSDRHLYRDYYVYIALAGVLAIAFITVILMFNRLKLSRTNMSYIGLLFMALVAVSIPYCVKGTYYGIDTQAHMKRIEAIAQGLKDGQFPVMIGPNYANQYGELVALQPGLFLYIPALLRLLNISIPASYNLYMIMVNIATAIVTVLCAERLFTSIRWGMIAAVFYLIEPFRLFVMLNLGAGAGMGTALVFLPLLITGLHEAVNRGGFRWKYIAVGLWGLACSHVMGFALSCLVALIYLLFHFKQLFTREVMIALIKAAIMFAVLSVGVLVPFAAFYFTDWNRNALQWTDFYHFPVMWDREIQNVIALAVMIIAYFGARRTGYINRFVKGIFVIGFVSVLMATPVFPWIWFKNISVIDTFLSMMQYPRRFHFVAVPCVAYTAAEAICSNMDSRTGIRRKLMYSIVAVMSVGVLINYVKFYSPGKLFATPESGNINTQMEDYLPAGTLTEWYSNDTGEFSDYDDVEAYSYSKQYTHVDLEYTSKSDGQYMEFPMFYYEGYVAYDQDGNRLRVEKGNRNRVRVYLTKSDEIQELHLRYEVLRVYTVVFIFSLISGVLWLTFNIGALTYRAIKSDRITQ